MGNKNQYKTIDAYISQFSSETREKLEKLRDVIRETAPDAVERISYQMPAFYYYGNLVYFAAFKKHIGFYPTSSGIEIFVKELAGYKHSKGAIQFPLDKPLPYDLIKKIVEFRMSENIQKK